MPRFDGTGPSGGGPTTGWGRGFCSPAGTAFGPYPGGSPAYWGPAYGRGFGSGRGIGRGRGYGQGFGPGMGRGRGAGRGYGFFRRRPW